jgi:hypothetical protein
MGEQLIEEVVTKLADDLVENVCMPDIGPDRALSGDVSRGPATEAGAGEHAHLSLIDIHQNDCQKDRRQGMCKQSQSMHECWNGEYGCHAWLRQCGQGAGRSSSCPDMSKYLILPESVYTPSSVVGEVWGGSGDTPGTGAPEYLFKIIRISTYYNVICMLH